MKEANFFKRLSAITLAAAITAANVGFDFLPTAKKAAAEPQEESSVAEVKMPEVMTQKSKYPTSLSFIVEQNENGESVLRASSPEVFDRYFTAELVSLDPPAEGEEPEQPEFSAAGTVIRKGGNYTVNVRAKVDEETGELLYNPYTIVSGSVPIAEEAAAPEAETDSQEIAVIEESGAVAETTEAEIPQETAPEDAVVEEVIPDEQAESAEITEIPVITETSVNICESDINAAFGVFDMSQSQKLGYIVVKSQDSYNVMIPDDYDELFLNGIDEEGNAFFNAAGEEVQVNFNEVEMNIQEVNFAELKVKDIGESEEYSIERFCGDETLPYYYGEIMKVTPVNGYNIVIGDMKYSDAVSVAVNDDEVASAKRWITVEANSAAVEIVPADPNTQQVDGKFPYGAEVIVQPDVNADKNFNLKGYKYNLSVNGTSLSSENKPLTFTLNDDVIGENDVVKINCNRGNAANYYGIDQSIRDKQLGFGSSVCEVGLVKMYEGAEDWWDNGYSTPRLYIPDKVTVSKCYFKSYAGKEILAEYDVSYKEDGTIESINLVNSSITDRDALYKPEENSNGGYWYFPIDLNKLHDDIYLDIAYDVKVKFSWTFGKDSDGKPEEGIIDASLNGNSFDDSSLYTDGKANYVNFTINEHYADLWDIKKVEWDGKEHKFNEAKNGYLIGKTAVVKKHGNYTFEITVVERKVNVTFKRDGADCRMLIEQSDGTIKDDQNNFSQSYSYNTKQEFTVYSPKGFYVDSIIRNENGKDQTIYSVDSTSDAYTSDLTSFNNNGNGEVTIKEKIYTENVTYKVNYAAVSESKDISASINADNFINNIDESGNKIPNSFSVLSKEYSVSFEKNKSPLAFCKDSDENEKEIATSGNKSYDTYDKLNADSDTIENDKDKELVYYVVNGRKIEKVKVNINKATTEPVITKFKISKSGNNTIIETFLNILSFGIFSNDDLTLTVYAEDTANNGLKISNIELYNNGDMENPMPGEIKLEDDGTGCKTYTLKQNNTYNLTAQAFSKFDPDDENENNKPTPEQNNTFVIDVTENKLNQIEVEVPAINVKGNEKDIPVIIEANAPTVEPLKLTGDFFKSGDDDYWVQDTAKFAVQATEPKSESGIHTIKYKVDDVEEWKTIDYSNDWNYTINTDIILTTKDQEFTNGFKVTSDTDNYVHTLKVVAVDNAGNESEESSVKLNIDGKKPVISEITAKTADGNDYTEDTWTNQNVTLNFSVTDGEGSGINNISVTDKYGNDITVTDLDNKLINYDHESGYKYNCKAVVNPDYSGIIYINATDNVGNNTNEMPRTINVNTEDNPPEISGLIISDEYDHSIKDKWANELSQQGYIDFFNTNVYINAAAVDFVDDNIEDDVEVSSGVSQIIMGYLPAPGENYPYDDVSEIAVNGEASFNIPQDFKGTLHFKVVDNAGNVSEWYSLEMLIAENPEFHDKHSGLDILLPDTPYSNGNPLYAEIPDITFNVWDSASGIDINSITYTISTDEKETSYSVDDLENKFEKYGVVNSGSGKINLSEYEENDIKITVKANDNAGNKIEEASQTISIDKTPPEIISVKFNPEGSSNQEFFNKQRTATVRVKDSNLNTANLNEMIDIAITNALGISADPYKITKNWNPVEAVAGDEIKGDEKVYECVITFVQDAEYSFTMNVEDLTNKTAKSEAFKFIIDTTQPKLTITFDNNSKANEKYYNAGRKATLTINEHNFAKNKDSVKSVLSAKGADGITAMDSKEIYDGKLVWTQSTSNKDEWTAKVNFGKEGTFAFSMAYTDPAGNNGNDVNSGEFVIDTTAPKIEQTFTKSGDKLATNDDLVPHVVFSDYNFLSENQIGDNCKVTIKKIDEHGLSSESFSATSRTYTAKKEDSPVTFEQIFDIFDKEIEVDGIYEVAIRAEDLAGNVTETNDLTVSVNRFGPTYMIVNDEAREAVEMYAANGIPIKDEIDLEIAEVNVTPSKGKGVVKVNIDGTSINELKDGFETSESRVALEDDSWESNENGWYQTLYKIDRKNFVDDGVYTVTLESEDEAGNKNISDVAKSPRANFAAAFAVDKTAPSIIIAGMDEEEYKESELPITITCSDRNIYNIDELNYDAGNKDKSTFYVKINDEYHSVSSLKSQLGAKIENDASGNIVINMTLKADGKDSKQNVDVLIMDKAGNSTIETEYGILSATSRLPMIILIIAGVLVLGTAVFLITKKVRNR